MSLFKLLFRLRLALAPPETRRNDLYGEVRKFLHELNQRGPAPASRQAARQFLNLLSRMKLLPPTAQAGYARWIQEQEPTPAELESQRSQSTALTHQPLISFIIPVFNPAPAVLKDTLASLLAQTYPHWECWLMEGGSTDPAIAEVLREEATRDPRLQVRFLGENRGISGNINEARHLVGGEFVAVVDHDDLVAPNLLWEVALQVNEHPGAEIIYFDEDKVAADGQTRHSPWFKPSAWSPDLLLSTNYLMHGVFRRTLLDEMDWFDPDMSGAQDWDLALRSTRKERAIAHIPRVLYHWRQVPGSAAGDANAKPWAFEAQKRSLERHLADLNSAGAAVEFPSLGLVRVRWPVGEKTVSIIIPTKDKAELLRACLGTLLTRTGYPRYEIILLDTGSTEPETKRYYNQLEAESRIRVIFISGPFNYHRVNNAGVKQARGELLLFLNNDTEILDPDWLDEMAGWAARPEIGVVGAKLLRPDGTLQHAGIIMGLLGHGSHIFDGGTDGRYTYFGSTEWYRNYLAVTGACLMMRRQVFEELGGFDETYEVGYGDIEICLRAYRKGYRNVYTPFARLLHREGGSRGFDLPANDVLRASLQMFPVVHTGDPFFNPNLSYLHHQPTVPEKSQESRQDRLLKILENFNLIVQEKREPGTGDPFFNELALSISPATWPVFPAVLPQAAPDQGAPDGRRLLIVAADLSLSGAPLMAWMAAKHLLGGQTAPQIQVLSSRPGPLAAHFERAGIEVIVWPDVIQDARRLAQHIQNQDLVLANTIVTWRAVVAARALAKPCLWWIHESKYGWRLAHFNKSIARAFPLAGKVIFPCGATRRLYEPFSQAGNYETIPNGLDWEESPVLSGASPFQPDSSRFRIVSVASLEPRKGQDVLLRALADLPPEIRREVECYLVGRRLNERFCRRLERLAGKLEGVHFLGEIPRPEVRQLLKKADLFILPSRDEVFPTSLLEALAEGKGVIAAAVGGVPEMIADEREGLLFKAEDHRTLSRHIRRFMSDRDLLRACGERAGRTFHEKFSYDIFSKNIDKLINTILD